jgi:hypothetical protein
MLRRRPLKRNRWRRRKQPDRIRTLRDGREICSGTSWQRRKLEVYERDEHRCQWPIGAGICGLFLPLMEAINNCDHIERRGLGGGKRDDRLENLRLLCEWHHRLRHELDRKVNR